MPDDVDPMAAGNENHTPEAPPARSGPLASRERMDVGCLLLMIGGFFVLFALPAFFLLGGAPLIIPLILLLLVAVLTPFINPAERKSEKARWIGRGITFFVLAMLLVGGWALIFLRDAPLLRE
jgi:hypothetical protein